MYAVDSSAGAFLAPAAGGAQATGAPPADTEGGAAFAEHVAEALRGIDRGEPEQAAEPPPAEDAVDGAAEPSALAVLMTLVTGAPQTQPETPPAPPIAAEAGGPIAAVADNGASSSSLASLAADHAAPSGETGPEDAGAASVVTTEPAVPEGAMPPAVPSGERSDAHPPAAATLRGDIGNALRDSAPAGDVHGSAPVVADGALVQVTGGTPQAEGTQAVAAPTPKATPQVAAATQAQPEVSTGQTNSEAALAVPPDSVAPQGPAPAAEGAANANAGRGQVGQPLVPPAPVASGLAAHVTAFEVDAAPQNVAQAGETPVPTEPAATGSGIVPSADAELPSPATQGSAPPTDSRVADVMPAGHTTAPTAVPTRDAALEISTPAASARAGSFAAALASLDMDATNVQNVVRSMRLQTLTDGASEARLRLEPEHLGAVALTVRVEQGSVSAHFRAETPDAQRWIETHQQELRTALREQGLEVKELVVTTDPDGRQQQERQPDAPSRQRPRIRRQEAATWDAPRFEVVV
ncbi:MAG TPA: flagellar hook-length control protein FliK [Vicinamibacterales bacterium]